MIKNKFKAMTLVEVLLAVVLVAVVAIPLWDMLVTTRMVTASAEELSAAVTLATSSMSVLKSLPKGTLKELDETKGENCGFGISKAPSPFGLYVEVKDTGCPIGQDKVYHVKITIRWQSRRVKRELDYSLEALLQ